MAEDLNIAGGMPPAFRNNLLPRGCDNPASNAASSLLCPVAIAFQNLFCSSRPAAEGRPGDGNGARPDLSERRLTNFIATSNFRVLRRPFESAQYASIAYRQRLADRDFTLSTSRPGNPVNAKAESFMKTLKAEEINGKAFVDLDDARRRINSFIGEVYNKERLHSALGYQSPLECETAFAQNKTR
ncbi:integrase core domain-containing protein [Bradyrhizobium sp. SSUT77]|uniref:integrase core domain-containing protein n=1 Tax=Bradyrhizobium sp. SSUT77 TaxID=3040603 RepID=UPI00244A1BC5|nr:integrase core domain-containing protein [Bradyrhizobium sp. SSUT77]MDH2348160.1 integrase core domain-containing protein [Bradyrhizobium sp. SSUT77]